MYGYAAASAIASQFPPFTPPPKTTTPEALADQAAALAQTNATPAGNSAQTVAATTPQLVSATAAPEALPQASSAATTPTTGPLSWLWNSIHDLFTQGLPTPTNNWAGLAPSQYTAVIKQTLQAYFGVGISSFGMQMAQQLTFGPGGTTAGAQGAWYPTPQFASLGLGGVGGHGGGVGAVSANLASATKVGGLSVPSGWGTTPGALEESATEATAVNYVAGQQGETNGLLRGMPMGAGVGRRSATAFTHKYGFKQSVLVRPPPAG